MSKRQSFAGRKITQSLILIGSMTAIETIEMRLQRAQSNALLALRLGISSRASQRASDKSVARIEMWWADFHVSIHVSIEMKLMGPITLLMYM